MRAFRPQLILLLLTVLWAQSAAAGRIVQFAPIDALLSGVYDGAYTVGEVKRYGDFGLGTFDALDGEMVVDRGVVYQVRSDGSVHAMANDARTPFAVVTFFRPEHRLDVPRGLTMKDVEDFIDAALPSANLFYAVRLEGTFRSLTARSVPRQQRPYPPLVEAAKQQAVFDFEQVPGVVLGFRSPPFVKGLNVPGYHLHFLRADRKAGGHVLDFRVERAALSWQALDDFRLFLPGGGDFTRADLGRDREPELNQVERKTDGKP
ncbi:MAG: acetolactate decarboxylase [Sulfuricellaceae bacterium]